MRSSTSEENSLEPKHEPFELHTEEHGPTQLTFDTTPSQRYTPRRTFSFRSLWNLCCLLGVLFLSITLACIGWVIRDLPALTSLESYRPWRITRVMDIDRNVVMELAEQRRRIVDYHSLPPHVIHAFVAAEDARFFQHRGIAYTGILRAFWKNIWRTRGAPKQGGSTITQQVVKTFLLSFKQTYTRKIKEAVLALRLERNLRKWEILHLYLNQIDFGRGCYGIEEAARYYFGKSAKQLTISQAAILAGIPKNPERYNTANSLRLAHKRRNYVLRRMLEAGFITTKQYKKAHQTPIAPYVRQAQPRFQHDYYTAAVRQRTLSILTQYIQRRRSIKSRTKAFKLAQNMLYRGGLRIETAMSSHAQQTAVHSLRKGLQTVDKRQGYRGPIQQIPSSRWSTYKRSLRCSSMHRQAWCKALVTEILAEGFGIQLRTHKGYIPWSNVAWIKRSSRQKTRTSKNTTSIQKGDVIYVTPDKKAHRKHRRTAYKLVQIPKVQGAIVVIDPRSHQVRALVGGWNALTHPFNRALWARRQPGSTFKPILYTAAIASRKLTASSLIDDTPLKLKVDGSVWKPTNATGTYYNKPIRLRTSLAESINTVAVRILDLVTPYRTIAMARKLGIQSSLTLKPSLALGASAVRPIELTNAYATLAAHGMHDKPVLITRILTHNGQTIYNRLPNPKRVLAPSVAYIMTDLLKDVVRKGTARKARILRQEIAGKTGTSNRARNTWFIGYTSTACVGVWVGADDRRPLGRRESGARTALPVFIDWMQRNKDHLNSKHRTQTLPNGVVQASIDPETGELAAPHQSNALSEYFLKGTEPTQYAHNRGPIANPRDFYKMDP